MGVHADRSLIVGSGFVPAISRLGAYLWASPNTLIGLVIGATALCTGGRLRTARGVAEICGGLPGRVLQRLPHPWRFAAFTLGHVVIGTCEQDLDAVRAHEHVHVRQYERWGPLFLPAYALSSLLQALRGRRAYLDNRFEREAHALAPPEHGVPRVSSAAAPPAMKR